MNILFESIWTYIIVSAQRQGVCQWRVVLHWCLVTSRRQNHSVEGFNHPFVVDKYVVVTLGWHYVCLIQMDYSLNGRRLSHRHQAVYNCVSVCVCDFEGVYVYLAFLNNDVFVWISKNKDIPTTKHEKRVHKCLVDSSCGRIYVNNMFYDHKL